MNLQLNVSGRPLKKFHGQKIIKLFLNYKIFFLCKGTLHIHMLLKKTAANYR